MVELEKVEIFAIFSLAVAIRAIISLHPFSGKALPPMFGDYEAQRHWQEVTVNLIPSKWYINSTDNDLQYWGLDYPPLTAYHSLALGSLAKRINESFVELNTSRGMESETHKHFMRLTVLAADIFLYIPSLVFLGVTLKRTFDNTALIHVIFVMALYPGQILIDNGHFQYNNISLGLAALAISSILRNNYNLAAVFFTLALNYKQMELYHALPIFVYLLRFCVLKSKSLLQGTRQLFKISSVVLLTFAVLWIPWLGSFELMGSVLKRLFPIGRGVFEDKVANFWCAANVVLKLKQKASNQQMALLCLGTTLAAVLPINGHLFLTGKKDKFLFCLTNTAVAFYLFSFQVHEKSILLAVLPAFCLFGFIPFEIIWFLEVATISMFPLFIKDGLAVPFVALIFIYHVCLKKIILCNDSSSNRQLLRSKNLNLLYFCSTFVSIILCITTLLLSPPSNLPFLWPLLISLHCFFQFFTYFFYGLKCQVFR